MRSLLCVSFVFLFSATAIAQFGKNPPPRTAARSNGATERKTTEKGTDRATKAADLASAEADLANAVLAAMDTDGDGVVTSIEYAKAMKAINRIKKDSKGNRAYTKSADANNAAAAGGDPAQAGAGAGAGADARTNETVARFMRYDKNGDGVLSPDEVPAQAKAMLRDADLNHDGVIDAKELEIFSRKMGEQMRALGAGVGPNGGNGVPGDGRKPPQQREQ